MGLLISGGRLIDPANGIDAVTDIYIAKSRVAGIGSPPEEFQVKRTIDATGQIVCPGLIDFRARLREPGQEYKATVASESKAALAGGITAICTPPDTNPVVDTPAMAHLIRQLGRETKPPIRLYPIGALTRNLAGEQLSDLAALREAGCVGFSNCKSPIRDSRIMQRLMEYAVSFDLVVHLHSVDPWLAQDGCMHQGAVSTRLGLTGIPESAEIAGVARDLALISQTGVRAHFCHISSGKALNLIRRARFDGLRVTADVTAHHLHLSEHDVGLFDSRCHVVPPFRSQSDLAALRRGLIDGTIDAISSDHEPHEPDAKLAPFAKSEPGISGLETLLPLTLKLVNEGIIALPDAIAKMTAGPAQILGLKSGRLDVGAAADVCIFDPDAEWEFKSEKMISRGKNTPFDHWPFQGRVTHTLIRGKLAYSC